MRRGFGGEAGTARSAPTAGCGTTTGSREREGLLGRVADGDALIAGGALAKTKFAAMSAPDLFFSAAPFVQRILWAERRATAVEDALAMTADPVIKAHILSRATLEASAWLTAMPGSGRGSAVLTMTDDQFGLALRAQVDLPILPAGSACICNRTVPLSSTCGDHMFSCKHSSLSGGRVNTHAAVLYALEGSAPTGRAATG